MKGIKTSFGMAEDSTHFLFYACLLQFRTIVYWLIPTIPPSPYTLWGVLCRDCLAWPCGRSHCGSSLELVNVDGRTMNGVLVVNRKAVYLNC